MIRKPNKLTQFNSR